MTPVDVPGCLVLFSTFTIVLKVNLGIPQLLKDNEAKSPVIKCAVLVPATQENTLDIQNDPLSLF